MTIKFDTNHADELRAKSVYELARLAECGDPDSADSVGAEFLKYVRDSVIEAFEYDSWGTYPEDTASQIADSCVPVWNYATAQTWTDLTGWVIDADDLSEGVTDVIKLMSLALYVAGDRLARALFEEYKHTLEEIEEVA